jgi:hypothetical protein
MNSNLAEVGKPTRWPPGKSGNPAGKPPGTRTAFSQGFILALLGCRQMAAVDVEGENKTVSIVFLAQRKRSNLECRQSLR